MTPRPEDKIPFRTRPEDARLDSPIVTMPSGRRITALPLADGVAPRLKNGMFLRASLARCDVAPALAQFGLVPITREDFLEMTTVGLWTPARPLTATPYGIAHMTSLGFSQRHDEQWWDDIQAMYGSLHLSIANIRRPILCAKSHAAGPDGRVDRMVGGDRTDDGQPDLWQAGTGPNHEGQPDVHDYWTKTYGKKV